MKWLIQQEVGRGKNKRWKTVAEFVRQRDAEQAWMRQYFAKGRIVSEDGKTTISCPLAYGDEKEN
jgi:hypothetical protein